MKYVNYAAYTSDADLLERVRPAHREYAEELAKLGKLVLAGPFVGRPGGLFVYVASSRAEALELVNLDPYMIEGVFVSIELTEWSVVGVNSDLLASD